MRYGMPLKFFKDSKSKYYIFLSDKGIVDYDCDYSDNKSFCELIYKFILYETHDEEYAKKILKILAKKLGIDSELKPEI